MSSIKYRHLGRDSAHRQALLRNLVTSLIEHESITTTWPKAKEAQRLAEKLITLGKKNTEATRRNAQAILYDPHKHLPKLLTTLAERYANRPGGYTRLLRSEPIKDDAAPSAVLSLVDGPRDMRFAMTAKTLLRERADNRNMTELTALNVRKVTRFREGGEEALEAEVRRLAGDARRVELEEKEEAEVDGSRREWVEAMGPGKLKREKIRRDALETK